ncbi:MAG TPA: reverse transcriptase family protein [Puia sp.]
MSSSQYKKAEFKKYEFKKLCHLLGFNQGDITKLLESVGTSYHEWTENKTDRDGKAKTYLDGTIKTRTFRNPSVFLKAVQKRIKKNILDQHPLPDCVHGGVKGRSNVTNAKAHQGKKYIFETDLQDFYPNISMRRVYRVFIDLGYSTHVAHWLTKMTTRSDELPQGSPTSTGIANLVFLQTDNKLQQICDENVMTYTRFVDDLTFSSQKDFADVIGVILNIIIEDNFKISRRKTIYKGKLSVTGINIFLNKIDAPQHIVEKSANEIALNTAQKPYTNYLNYIRKTNAKKKRPPTC